MLKHTDLGTTNFARLKTLQSLIAKGEITLGGYTKGKIYGTLNCKSGKRMKAENQIFFKEEQEALHQGYRPCGHCMREQFKLWKLNNGTK